MADNVTGIILLFLAVFLLLRGLPGVVELVRARGWQRATGTMLGSGVANYQTQATAEQMSANVQQAVFAYRYEVGGRTYTGHRAAFGTPLSFGTGLGAIASAQASRYSPGEEVDVWADPADPSRAVLRRSAPSSVLMTALGVAVGCLNPIPGEQRPGCAVPLESPTAADPKQPPLLMSFLYLALRKLNELALLRARSTEDEELEIVVLRHRAELLLLDPWE